MDSESVGTNECDVDRTNVGRHGARVEQRPARHFLHALRARTGEPQIPSGNPPGMAAGFPLEENAIVTPGNGGGNRRCSARTALLGYLTTRRKPADAGRLINPQRSNATAGFP